MVRPWFEEWRSFEDFKLGKEQHTPEEVNFRERRFKFWREAWVAVEFVERTIVTKDKTKLRLTTEGSPAGDFELDDGDRIHNFEIAEATDPSMILAWKKMITAGGRVLPEAEESISGKLAREKIPALITKKSQKGYPPNTSLIIYLNLWTDFDRMGLHGLVPKVGHKFSAIWLLTSGRVERIFPTEIF